MTSPRPSLELPLFNSAVSRRQFLCFGIASAGMALTGFSSGNASERTQIPNPLRILILGAGLSGLVAADELKRGGHNVTILEATLRAGGRVRTLREPFADNLYAEAGAGRIPTTHNLTREYAKRFGLRLAPYRPKEGASVFYGVGRRFVVAPDHPLDLNSTGLPFSEEEMRLGIEGMYRKYLAEHTKQVGTVKPEEWPSATVQYLGDISIAEFLERQGASRAAKRYLCVGYEEDSALDYLRDAYSHEAPQLDHIVGGNDLLPKALAGELSRQIIYGAPVVRIEQDRQSARVIFKRHGQEESLIADRVICTLPFSTLRRVEFSPRLSAGKQRALNELPYGSVTRVYLQYRRRFWLDEGCNGFADMLDLPMEIWNPTHDQPGERGIQLGYLYERLARKVAAMNDSKRIAFLLNLTDRIYPGARRNFEGGTSFSWAEQPYQLGAYAVYNKGLYGKIGPDVRKPEGRIHFAGEHTSPWPGWMQGAIYSGLHAAREVCETRQT